MHSSIPHPTPLPPCWFSSSLSSLFLCLDATYMVGRALETNFLSLSHSLAGCPSTYLYVWTCTSKCLYIYLFIHLPMPLPSCSFVCACIYFIIYISTCAFISACTSEYMHLPVQLLIVLCICPPICAAVNLSISLGLYSSNIYPSVYVSVYPSIYASTSMNARKESKWSSPVEDVTTTTVKELGKKNGHTLRSIRSCSDGPTFSNS